MVLSILMNYSRKFFLVSLILIALTSCNNPPEAYEKAQLFFQSKKFDSSLVELNSITAEAKSWLDSSKKMQGKCFSEMARLGMWNMYGKSIQNFKNIKFISDTSSKILTESIITKLRLGNQNDVFNAVDNFKNVLPNEPLITGINKFLDQFLCASNWEAVSGDLRGHIIYFTREEYKTKHVESKGLLLQGKSRNTVKSWHAGRVIYRNLRYENGGKFRMEPLIIKEEDFEYGENGSITILGNDSIKINYGQKLSASSSKKIFVRMKE
jgi:hypothetical protein